MNKRYKVFYIYATHPTFNASPDTMRDDFDTLEEAINAIVNTVNNYSRQRIIIDSDPNETGALNQVGRVVFVEGLS